MSFLGSLLGNEVSHNSNLFSGFGAKNGEQLLLGAADPLGAKLWGGITGQNFTPMVTQLGGETQAQYGQSDAQGVNTGPSRFMGSLADAIAGAEAGSYFSVGGLGGLASGGGGTGGGVTTAPAPSLNGMSSAAAPQGVDLSGQSSQQKLATALMMPNRPQQGSALDNVASIAQTPTLRMLAGRQAGPFSLGGTA